MKFSAIFVIAFYLILGTLVACEDTFHENEGKTEQQVENPTGGDGASPEEPAVAPLTPIVSGTEKITLKSPQHLTKPSTPFNFVYEVSSDAKYIFIGLFSVPVFFTNGRISNMDQCKYGSQTGYAGFVRGCISSNNLYIFESTSEITGSFIGSYASVKNGTYYWVILAWDSNMNLIASSPQWTVMF